MAALIQIEDDSVEAFCGGVLIAPDVVLTAAHCVDSFDRVVSVALGRHNLDSGTEDSNVIVVNTRAVFSLDFNDDHGLVFFDEAVDMNGLALAKLNRDPERPVNDDTLQVIGWGLTETGEVSPVLKETNVTYRSNEECAGDTSRFDSPTYMCALYDTGRTCQGDSGSPIYLPNDLSDYRDDIVVGVVSFGFLLCLPGEIAGFTRVTERINWIDSHVCTDSSSSLPDDFPCPHLPFLTIVLGGTGTANLRLTVMENTGDSNNLPFPEQLTLDELSPLYQKKVYLYPFEDGVWKYDATLEATGTVAIYQLWLGDNAGGTLLKESAGVDDISDTFAFELDEAGDPTILETSFSPSFLPTSTPSASPSSSMAPSSSLDVKPENGPYLLVVATLDFFPSEFGWDLVEIDQADGSIVTLYERPFGTYTLEFEMVVLYLPLAFGPDGSRYVFTASDSYGDGSGPITLTYVDADNGEYPVSFPALSGSTASVTFFVDGNGVVVETSPPTMSPSQSPSSSSDTMEPTMEPTPEPTTVFQVVPESGPYLRATVTFDERPWEFIWELYEVVNETSFLLYEEYEFTYTTPNETVNINVPLEVGADGSIFIFAAQDFRGDGLTPPGGFSLVYVDAANEEHVVLEFGKPFFRKYQIHFTVDENGVLVTSSPTNSPTMGPTTALETLPEEGGPYLLVRIRLDVFPEEFGWVLTEEEIVNGSPTPPVAIYEQPFGTHKELFKEFNIHLPLDTTDGGGGSLYNFTVLDSGGNGICCRNGRGSYTLSYVDRDDEETVFGGDDGGGTSFFDSYSESTLFFVDADGRYVNPLLSEVPSTMPSEYPSSPPVAKGKKKGEMKGKKGVMTGKDGKKTAKKMKMEGE